MHNQNVSGEFVGFVQEYDIQILLVCIIFLISIAQL